MDAERCIGTGQPVVDQRTPQGNREILRRRGDVGHEEQDQRRQENVRVDRFVGMR